MPELFQAASAEWSRIRRMGWSIMTSPAARIMRDFAEQEIIIPDGPFKGLLFRCERQPWTSAWFAEVDSHRWQRHVATGPSQSGKTLACYVIPGLYHLFEIGETVICGVPRMEMSRDKWERDFLPAIEASRYRELLPTNGKGSRGGAFDSITFRNGAALKFMSGGGDDKIRAGFTARVLLVTEVDGIDIGSDLSRETDPISQMEARLRAFGDRRVVYLECTASVPTGRIWTEFEGGTASQLALPCPHCKLFVSPERGDFRGWETASTEVQAEKAGMFFCPSCGTAWTPEQRIEANQKAVLLHRGQEITADGRTVGTTPETRTLGFRWSAVHNLFTSEKQLGAEEWKSARRDDRESAEKERLQFVWAQPWRDTLADAEINPELIASRLTGIPRGKLPNDSQSLTIHVDLHNRWHYWTALATSPNHVYSVVDYGIFATPDVDRNGPQTAIRIGLEQLADELSQRSWMTVDNRNHPVDLIFVDAGYQQDTGLAFVTGAGSKWMLHKGERETYRQPKEAGADCKLGEHWFLSRQEGVEASGSQKWWLALSNTSHWMRVVHAGLAAEAFLDDGITRRPGSIGLFGTDPEIHLTPVDRLIARSAFATQLTAWKFQEVTTPRRGTVLQWVSQFREDHFFDTTYGCLVAAHVAATIPDLKSLGQPMRRTFQLPASARRAWA